MNEMKYCEYFNINETYFPCIDESAINAGVDWQATYPHATFIKLLKATENMLGGATKRSVWIHGAYGTGKSQCAYALKRMLESSENDLRQYWDKYEPLKKESSLLEKFLGHKEQGIVTAYRYASGSIDSPQQLFFAVQESIQAALVEQGIEYKGEQTLKEGVIDWLSQASPKLFVNSLLNEPEWKSLFSQSSADEIIKSLRKGGDVSALMNNIFRMAAKVRVTAFSLDADKLLNWIKDIIEKNKIKIVLVWDEFSDFFRLNKNSLGEFQKIVSLCEEAPFYFIVVTHPISSISSNDDSWKIVQQRFDRVEIEMPENIAFELIGHAFSVKDSAKDKWNNMRNGLEALIPNSTAAVMKAANIKDREVIKRILPIQPIAALLLKNIANAFQSNQRSMFDFIKSSHDIDVKAFQWFIKEYGPMDDDQPLLTVDMLWDFFYVKGKEYLTADIKLILDTFPQQTALTEKEKKVLKAVLIMQAIDQRLGGSLPILKPTDQNLDYAFEGISGYETSAKNIAKALEQKGVLICTPIGDGKKAFGAAVLAGDNAKIESSKTDIRKKSTINNLVFEGDMLATALSLTPPLRIRFAKDDSGALPIVTISDFSKTMDALKNKDMSWRFYTVLALAKDDDEAQNFRALIKRTIANEEYRNIIVIDALSSPLGLELFEQYVDYSAMAMYYQGNNNQQAKENSNKAKNILNRTWKERIHDGQFYIYTFANQDGEKAMGANNVHAILQTLALSKFRHIFDFTKGLTETQLKLTTAKTVARYGMGDTSVKGLIAGCEKSVLGLVWDRESYWAIPELQGASIVIIKQDIDKLIADAFAEHGQISIGEIYDHLQDKYGFSPCNLSAFVTGFLLKEYSSDPYRCIDSDGHPNAMTPDKLSEMIGNYIGKTPKPTFIVKMTQEEKTFYEATEEIWDVPAKTCSSPSQVGTLISNKMRVFGYPTWCLEYVDDNGVYDIVKKFIALVQSEGKSTHNIAIEIGKIIMQKPTFIIGLKGLLNPEKCKAGMLEFLKHYKEGKLMTLADEIGAKDIVLSNIKTIFSSVKYSAMWVAETGVTEIDKLITEYEVIKQTNGILNVACNTIGKCFEAWREVLKFAGFSCDALKTKRPSLEKLLSYLLKVMNREDILPEIMKEFLAELVNHRGELSAILNNKLAVFEELYGVYLDNFTVIEREEIQNSINRELFTETATTSNSIVKQAADVYRKNQIKTQLFNQWFELTGTKNPKEWSHRYQTPILCLVDSAAFSEAKRTFAALNSTYQSDSEIRTALEFINNSKEFFDNIQKQSFRDEAFMRELVGQYAVLLDINRVRNALDGLAIEVYDWYDSPIVKQKIQQIADSEYYAGGSDKALGLIDRMSDAELKRRLKELVQKDVELGMKIILNEDK